jgi:cellulose synthase (UDP-forming)
VGLVRLLAFDQGSPLGVYLNLFWVAFDLVILSVVIEAARYRGSTPPEEAEQPAAGKHVREPAHSDRGGLG